MSTLPEALRPWASALSLFPEDLALSVGAHVARLAAALGPLRALDERVGGEMQGYDGLTRRGSPERLLMTEWLMALEAPDEFVRRAAFGEQAYLRPAFRQPKGGRRAVALLDAGPDQLGAPRIAHLALLVVLARRAEAAGAGFVWGVLQSPPGKGPFTTVDPATLRQWLRNGSLEPATGAHLDAWREALQVGQAPDDVWLVGGARLARLPGAEGLSRVTVEEGVEPGVQRLAVEVRPASRPPRQVLLELPPAPQCVRLLRDPFGTAVTTPVLGTGSVRSLRFSADGLRLLMSHGDGSVSAQSLPSSPNATVPRSKRFVPHPGETVVAFGWRRTGGLLVVTRHEKGPLGVHGTLKGHPSGKGVTFPGTPDAVPFALPNLGEPPLLALSLLRDGKELPFVLDEAGHLIQLAWNQQPPGILFSRRGVLTLAERRGGLFFTERDQVNGVVMQLAGWLSPIAAEEWTRPLGVQGQGSAYFGLAKDTAQSKSGPPLAVHLGSGCWWVTRNSSQVNGFELSSQNPVVGLYRWPADAESLELVVLREDQRTFAREGTARGSTVLFEAPAPVAFAAVSHSLPLLAFLTKTGEVGVWSFQHKALVYRRAPKGAS